MPCSDIIVIVMAAGQSIRFGSNKKVAKFDNEETLLSFSLRTIQNNFSNSHVVIKPEDNAQSLGLTPTNHAIISQRSHLGLGYSISDAFRQLCSDESIHHYRAAAVWLTDLPRINKETCSVLAKMATPESTAQPLHQGNPEHPVVFGREFWHELALLEIDRGAIPVIKKHSNRVIHVSFNDTGVCTDVGYPDDLTKSLKNTRNTHAPHKTTTKITLKTKENY